MSDQRDPTPTAETRPRSRRSNGKPPEASVSEFDGVRYLHLGHTPWVQGAMRVRKPRVIELEYVRRMMSWLLLHDPARWDGDAPELHTAQLGLGAATLTRYCHGELGLRATAVELNPQVIAACRQWFRLPANDERLTVVYGDAGDWVRDAANAGTVDALCVDLYDHQAAAPVLDDVDFYAACHACLAPGGVLSVNLFGRSSKFARSARRIESVFAEGGGSVRVVAATEEGNTVVLALKGEDWPDAAVLADRARVIEARTGLDAPLWTRLLRRVPAERAAKAAATSDPADGPSNV
ncbi:spermine/spermidine synthase domain-containing protein [Leptothrix sp. BB-4]